MSENTVSETVAVETKATKPSGPTCAICGKPISDPASIKRGIGPLCFSRGWTKEKYAEFQASLSSAAIPEGYVEMAAVCRYAKSIGVSVLRVVRFAGGDRAILPILDERFAVTYVGRRKYMPQEAMSAVDDMKAGKLVAPAKVRVPKAPKEKVAKAAKPEGAQAEAQPAQPKKTVVIRPGK